MHKITEALLAYGTWGVLLLTFLDSMGIPIPAAIDVLLLGVAASSVDNPQHAYLTALLAVLVSTAGNIVLFLGAALLWLVTFPFDPERRLLHLYTCWWSRLYVKCIPGCR